MSRHLSGWTPVLWLLRISPHLFIFFFGADIYVKCIFSSSFENFVLEDVNYKCWISDLKKQSLVSGFVLLHFLVSYMTLMMPLGAKSRWVSKGYVPQTGYRWCVGPVLSGPGIKWCSSTPYCSIHLCRVGSGLRKRSSSSSVFQGHIVKRAATSSIPFIHLDIIIPQFIYISLIFKSMSLSFTVSIRCTLFLILYLSLTPGYSTLQLLSQMHNGGSVPWNHVQAISGNKSILLVWT